MDESGWHRAEFPESPRGSVACKQVPTATLTTVTRGPLGAVRRPTGFFTGAVYDADGRLVRRSQRLGGLGGAQRVAADANRLGPLTVEPERLAGHWMYGGHWFRHFGHFFTETITTLWPEPPADCDGLVFHAYYRETPPPDSWQPDLLELAGYGGLPIRLVQHTPMVVEQLTVPSRPVVLNGWAHPEAALVWDRVVTAAGGPATGTERLFLSRSKFEAEGGNPIREARTSAEWNAGLDAAFTERGFEVVHPQDLSVRDQVRLVAGAGMLAGSAGTALHLAAFGPGGRRVLEVGDARLPESMNPMQRVINAARDHEQAFVPYGDIDDLRRRLDLLLQRAQR
ncbi:glycosyltransferase family 61 protein [Nocardioides bigeumensis]|uniref:Glycosyltransferase 61 catalytic domain-containing protein n=1 Tax=Nocardioides bigeumensis TaxID=433657 RepID=A0ABN2YB70_9ACTN